jgi:stage V sporulation protein R
MAASTFRREIGFDLERKQRALDANVDGHRWFRRQSTSDEVVSIVSGCADVYDITVDEAHAYVANGLVNHNSFWHARIMRELDLTESEYVQFAQLHSGVLSPSTRNVNPYYVGMKIFEDIERRWDEPSDEERKKLGRPGGEGRTKIFEVRQLDNDASFLRNYLTRDLVEELDLYLYRLEGDTWVIVEKDWEVVRDTILAGMTNFGQPYIVVEDADYRRGRELYLKHRHEGDDLDLDYANKTMRYLYQLWSRPIHLETIVDGKSTVLTYEGQRGHAEPVRYS